jgi:cellulose synthase/poly-beta-1,6-N-acetylglucosamine synthase-like glycosyltransferase
LRQWGSCVALSDHVGNRAKNPVSSRYGKWAFADIEQSPFGFSNDNWRQVDDDGPADELDCLRGVLAPQLLRAAERRAAELGIGADQVLIRQGVIDEEAWLRRLSYWTGVGIETFAGVDRDDLPLSDRRIATAAGLSMLPIRRNGGTDLVLAPRHLAARNLCRLVRRYPHLVGGLRLTSRSRLDGFLLHQTDGVLGHGAANGLRDRFPDMSAALPAARERWRRHLQRLKGPCAIAALLLLPPIFALEAWGAALALWFLAFIGLRLCGSFRSTTPPPILPRLPDRQLPVYTVVAALYREAKSVALLMQAINAFDYPREKLQVIIVLEPNDLATRAAIARLGPMPHVQVLIAPAIEPTTKPKALNCALPFVRGAFTAVFDAEDRPDPGQLRAALDAFRSHDDNVACAQASLCIHNVAESWLTAMFAAEYAGQFDVFLPGFAAMRLPLPLGGSSNHFRTSVLREVGGWDAWNVTEDADLGFRLARFGYRSVTFDSTTWEEAPVKFRAWLGQRSRWMKGWMQTWLVHMRDPRALWREAGPRGFMTLNILVGGNVLTALVCPVLVIELAGYVLTVSTGVSPGRFLMGSLAPLHIATVVAGLLSTVLIGLTGLARRGRLRTGWILLATPLYWGCLSVAAWHALWKLWRDPWHWEKTEHGVTQSQSSRAAQAPSRMPRRAYR